MTAADRFLLVALARIVEYQLRGERDRGLQDLRRELLRNMAAVTNKDVED